MALVQRVNEAPKNEDLLPCPQCNTLGRHEASEPLATEVARLRTQLQVLQEVVNGLINRDKTPPPQPQQSPEAVESKETTSRVRYITSRIGEAGKRIEIPGRPPSPSKKDTSAQQPQYAFEAKEYFDDFGKATAQITLTSPKLREAVYGVLRKQFEHNKDTQWASRDPSLSVLKAPFSLLLGYWKELSEEANRVEGENAGTEGQEDLKILLQHIRDLQPELILQIESLPDATRISQQHLEILFRPGTLIMARPHLNQPQIFKVHGLSVEEDEDEDMEGSIIVKCWAYDWTGAALERVYYNFHIKNFDDEREIKDLPCYPVRYYEDEDGNKGLEALKEKLVMRGKKFRKICIKKPGANSMCLYKGRLIELHRPRRFGPPRTEWVDRESLIYEPIMVDFESFQHECREPLPVGKSVPWLNANHCNCQQCLDIGDQRWRRVFTQDDEEIEDCIERELDRNYLLLPSRVLGWAFKSGSFAQFFVDDVEPYINDQPGQEFDDRLIFPEHKEENKNDIKRLILGHKSDEGERTIGNRPLISDAVEGKGKGLVILLHGPPGVGKTLTAELGARAAGRPLYKVGASDIGLHPEDAERSFSRLFSLASRWQAVLLIDEAEVFLDTRGPKGESDVNKNALVSVLLRALEYFKGVLIMTTNRVMTLDPAMVSRIHYAVSLGPLDKDQETKIWKSYTAQLNSKNCADTSKVKKWAETKTKKKTSDMNGRQIRNLFTTAQALAEGELVEGVSDGTGKISIEHLQRVNETMATFREDMHELLIIARTDAAKP